MPRWLGAFLAQEGSHVGAEQGSRKHPVPAARGEAHGGLAQGLWLGDLAQLGRE